MTTLQPPPRVLAIDDDIALLRALSSALTRAGCRVEFTVDPLEGLNLVRTNTFDLLLVDLEMPVLGGIEILQEVKRELPDLEVLIMTAHGSVETAVDAMKSGASDYLLKPFTRFDEVVLRVNRAAERRRLKQRNRELERRVTGVEHFEDLVGQSDALQRVFELIDTVGRTTATVLIQGESGTGKELVARALHRRSPRANGPFLAINCSALTESLLEAELFGHVKGAFTGAHVLRRGLFEAASSGTLFLDEIGDVSPGVQVRLLRALQFGAVRRVGASEEIPVDVRVVAASHRNLERATREGTFREDLFYRLNVITIALPALRDRAEDIAPLAYHFLRRSTLRHGKTVSRIAPRALQALEAWSWPGNVRELENAIERAVVLAQSDEVAQGDLPPSIASGQPESRARTGSLAHLPYLEAKEVNQTSFERRYLRDLLRQHGGNITHAARAAAMDRSNFRRLMKAAEIDLGEVLEDEPT